jgi:hypothetical protein
MVGFGVIKAGRYMRDKKEGDEGMKGLRISYEGWVSGCGVSKSGVASWKGQG